MVVTLSKSRQGKEFFAPHFRVGEFACKDGSDTIKVDTQLVWYLEKIRENFGKPVIINSAYRTEDYNKRIGGASESLHMAGKACDIVVKGIAPADVYKYADSLGLGGVGSYATFTHIDVRDVKARWKG